MIVLGGFRSIVEVELLEVDTECVEDGGGDGDEETDEEVSQGVRVIDRSRVDQDGGG